MRFSRHLDEQGICAADQLALFVALPDELWDAAWADLRHHVERERDGWEAPR